MKKIRQKMPAIFMILLAVLFIPGIANAKTKKEYQGDLWNFKKTIKVSSGAFTYYAYPSKNQKEAWIYKIRIKDGKDCSKLSIPSKLDNKKVTRLGSREWEFLKTDEEIYNIFGMAEEPWHDTGGGGRTKKIWKIRKLIIPNTVKVIQPAAFCCMDSVKTVKIPKNVETLEEHTFYGCDNLETIYLPAKLKNLNVMAFWTCPKLTEIKISSKNKTYQVKDKCVITKKKKELVYALAGGQTFLIPEGVKTIKAYAFTNCTSSTINIPASIKKIEESAFMNPYFNRRSISDIKNVTVDEKNSVYARDGQCIYNKTDKSLSVAIPDEKGVLYISEQVEKLTKEKNIVGLNISEEHLSKIVFPKTLKTVTKGGFECLRADCTYFESENPPELVKDKKNKTDRPINYTHVYVPEKAKEVYIQWYKKYNEYEWITGLDTFKPEDEI